MADLTFNRAGDFIVVTASGNYDIEDGRRIFQMLAVELTPGEPVSILIDLRATRRDITYAAVYRLLEEVRVHPVAATARAAALNRWQNQFEGSQFFEASAQHAGLQFRAFTDPGAALRWLLPDAPPEELAAATEAVRLGEEAAARGAG